LSSANNIEQCQYDTKYDTVIVSYRLSMPCELRARSSCLRNMPTTAVDFGTYSLTSCESTFSYIPFIILFSLGYMRWTQQFASLLS